jgi:hypothetical protein
MIRIRRHAAILAALIAALLVITGCGSGSGGSKPKGLDDLLAYVPANSPLVVTAKADPDSDQWKNVDKILGKFPVSGQIKGQFKQQLAKEHIDYDKDLRPLLGGDVLIAFPDARELATSSATGSTPVIGAWSTRDGGKLKTLITKGGGAREAGKSHGATLYTSGDEDWFAIDGNNALAATSRPLLEAALARHDGSDHLTEDNFNKAFEGLPSDPLARFYVNPRALLSAIPNAGAISSLIGNGGPTGSTLNVTSNKVELDSNQGAAGANGAVASGDESPGVVRASDELGIGWRNIAQTIKFYETTLQKIAPDQYGKFAAGKAAIAAGLGIDIDKDVVDQLSGNTYAAIGFNGWAVRSDVKDPAALKATLAKIAKGAKRFNVDLKPVGGLYQFTDDGTTIFVGVLGRSLVLASDGKHAAQIASEQVQQVPGAKGAVAINGDAKALADAGLQKFGQGMQAQFGTLFTGPLGAINGWFGGAHAHFEVTFK